MGVVFKKIWKPLKVLKQITSVFLEGRGCNVCVFTTIIKATSNNEYQKLYHLMLHNT